METDVVGRLASLAGPPRGSSPVVSQMELAAEHDLWRPMTVKDERATLGTL
jgi:hypothetical protein